MKSLSFYRGRTKDDASQVLVLSPVAEHPTRESLVFPITLPPLRERKEDIPALVSYFVDRYAKRAGRKIRGIRKSALDSLESYLWPGNIREMQNVIERSLIVCETDEFTIDKSWLSSESMPTRSTNQESIVTSAPGERESIE